MEKVYVITDLGPGDGGKGGIVHALAKKLNASIVIKRGGAQGSHGVCTSDGEKFNFSQWGCGTLDGIPTFLSKQMIISPVGLINESEALKYHGIHDPFKLISADPLCTCATPLHRISSQIEELLRKDNPRGTIGTGVGQAYRMLNLLGDEATIRASELTNRKTIRAKLEKQLQYYREKYADITENSVLPDDKRRLNDNLDLLYDDGYILYCLDTFEEVGKKLHLVSLSEIVNHGIAIVECSHGVLTDAEMGLKPHVSAIRTLPSFTEKMLREAGCTSQIVNYAVHRAYEVRHGAGPMPTHDPSFTEQMLPDSHKLDNRWQGAIRAGALDLNLIRYALNACYETSFDGICLTWFDQVLANGNEWQICESYNSTQDTNEPYTAFLNRAKPVIESHQLTLTHEAELFASVKDIVQNALNIPLKILSVGPTELDKIYSELD